MLLSTVISAAAAEMVLLEGGEFAMGSSSFYPEEAPVRRVHVDPFCIARHPVTNRQFAAFVAATGHVTVAEAPLDPADYPGVAPEFLVPGSLVFAPDPAARTFANVGDWWVYRPGASWRCPTGPGSSHETIPDHPAVHIAHADAAAYAAWAGLDLPTEAQWEYAARGGLDGAEYCWGERMRPDGVVMANTFEGCFPLGGPEGVRSTSPVGRYPPNGYGLFDMAGNVWEWTSDWYGLPKAKGNCCLPVNPRGAAMEESLDLCQPDIPIPRKVVKGGSYLCSPDYCLRFRPAARQPQMIDSAACHIGFRCVAPPG